MSTEQITDAVVTARRLLRVLKVVAKHIEPITMIDATCDDTIVELAGLNPYCVNERMCEANDAFDWAFLHAVIAQAESELQES